MKHIVGIALVLSSLLFQSHLLAATPPSCLTIEDEQQRLACYDKQAQITVSETLEQEVPPPPSPLRKRIDNEQWLSMIGEFVILPHRPTYIMPVTYMADPNSEPFREVYGDQAEDIQSVEVKYQLSFKVPLWQEITGRDISMWFGYTQLSLWQMYNSQSSSPFRETNYEPELAVAFTRDAKLFGMNNTFILAGLNHQSNGRSEPLSRSWNRLFASFILEKNNLVAIIKPWYRLPEESKDDDNPDIHQYLGYGELSLFYKQKKRVIGLRLWNNLSGGDNRTSLQFDWSFPIGSGLKGYVQYFNGYGETLVDYNYRSKRFGLGIMLTDWF